MTSPFALAALLAIAAPPAVPALLSAPAHRADPCAAAQAPAPEPACQGASPLCEPRERVRTTCELRDAIQSRYVFLEAKRKLLGGFDAAARLEQCAARERAIGREDDPLRFYDRIRRCLAPFQDGHLLVGAPGGLPEVAVGVGLRRAGDRIVVAWRDAGLAKLAGKDAAEALPIGAEVVLVDGRPPLDAAAELEHEIQASSPAARTERAVDALTRREFDHPEGPRLSLTVAGADGARRTIELPWWRSPGGEGDARLGPWVSRSGIRPTALLPWFEDAARPQAGTSPADGTPPWAPLFAPAPALREYADAAGRVAVRLGPVSRAGRDLCYLQILSFHSESLTGRGGARPFGEIIDGFVRECAGRGVDLVLDLRRNEGGFLDHAAAVARALSRPGARPPVGALLLRATERNEAVYRERAGDSPPRPGDPLAPRNVLDAIRDARKAGRPLTGGFVENMGGPSHGGYAGRVVALTGPACMSACDRLTALLRASGRAILVGGPTEGAGGSQQEAPGLSARWTDSGGLLSVSIPNATFGVPRGAAAAVVSATAAGEAAGEVAPDAFLEGWDIENRPVEPDVRHEPTAEDVAGDGRGWLEELDRVLAPPAAPPAGTVALARPRPARAG